MVTFKSYAAGFIFCLILTLAAFFAVFNHVHSVLFAIIGLALIQLIVQMVFFLHLGQGKDGRWNLNILISTFVVVAVLVVGSIVIMRNLNYNMTPDQMGKFIIEDEGYKP